MSRYQTDAAEQAAQCAASKMTVAHSMVSFGSCVQARRGVICQEKHGPHTTCYNRFVRWRRAGVWERIMNDLSVAHDAAVQMIDTSTSARTSKVPALRRTKNN